MVYVHSEYPPRPSLKGGSQGGNRFVRSGSPPSGGFRGSVPSTFLRQVIPSSGKKHRFVPNLKNLSLIPGFLLHIITI